MLKVLLPLLVVASFVASWSFVQLALFLICFLLILISGHSFSVFCLGYGMGVDYLSHVLILLTGWITCLMVGSSSKVKKEGNFSSVFLLACILLMLALLATFSCVDYLLFYISFESSLIPTLVLILGWGYQPERIQAGVYLLFYTLLASLPLLVSLLLLYRQGGSLTMGLADEVGSSGFMAGLWYLSTVLAFVVKLPVYFFHLWLPKAHVEAPVAGSMILAGVLLKLGGYGLIRVMPVLSLVNKGFVWLWMTIGVVGGLFVSVVCLLQVDIKSLVAYSSVAHMGLVLSGLMSCSVWGVNGAVVVMVGHGLCSSGLFSISNMVYERIGSRSLLVCKGLLSFMPSMGLWWFLLSIGNMAAPPTLNLLGEISLISNLVMWSKFNMLGVAGLSFLSAAYSLYLYSLSQHGVCYSSLYSCCPGKVREFGILFFHWFPLNLLILKSSLYL